MDDIAPALLQELLKAFESALAGDRTAAALLEQIHAGKAGYAQVGDYADRVGSALAKAFRQRLSSAVLPDGKMYWNIADRVVRTLLGRDYELVADAAKTAQLHLNAKAGIGIKPQTAPLNESRVDGILQALAAAEQYDEAADAVLSESVLQTYSRSVADETLEANLRLQHRAGLNPRIIRRATARACKWCRALEGSFDYPDNMPADVFRRHDNCKCRVEYDPGSGRRQTVHSGTEGKRTYVKDEYGAYTQTKETRIKHAQEMAVTEAERNAAARQKRIDTWAEKKSNAQATKKCEDVSAEYRKKAAPGTGTLTYAEGYAKPSHEAEIKTAKWIHQHLGGNISLLNEKNEDKVKTPDYLWNGALWELKTISTATAADSALRTAIKQIQGNPGGVVFDCSKENISTETLTRVIEQRLNRSCFYDMDVLILSQNSMIQALRYKK